MPRCKNPECKLKFTAKYFLQKYCCKECEKECSDGPAKIKQKSDKRKDQEEIYSPLRKAYLQKEPFCEVCGLEGSEIHHKDGRNGERLNEVKYFMTVCRGCHTFIHEHPKESREKGYLI